MDSLKRLRQFIDEEISKLEKKIQQTNLVSFELKKLQQYISNFDKMELTEIKDEVKNIKIFESRRNELDYQIEKIEKIQNFLELIKKSGYETLEIDSQLLDYFEQEVKEKLKQNFITLKKLNKYIDDNLFADEALKKNILESQKEFNNILEECLKQSKKDLLKIFKDILKNYPIKSLARNSAHEKYNADLLRAILKYKTLFDENKILFPFESKQKMQDFFEFLKSSTLNKEDKFELIVLFTKFNIGYYNKLKEFRAVTIKTIVEKNIEKATEKLESIVRPKELIKPEEKEEKSLYELTEEEINIYNRVKEIIEAFNVVSYDEDYCELFNDDFVLENRKEYYLNLEDINWKIIKTDFEKILEPNLTTHKEEVFAIFNYIIELYHQHLQEIEKNNKRIEILKEQKQDLDKVLVANWDMYSDFINNPEKNMILNYLDALDFKQQTVVEQYAEAFNVTVKELEKFHQLYKLNEFRKNLEEIIKSNNIDEDWFNIINEEYKSLLEEYKNVFESTSLEDNDELQSKIDPKQKNFVCILNEDILNIDDKNMKLSILASAQQIKYFEWQRLLSDKDWHTLVQTGSNGKQKDYSDEEFIAGRLRHNDYRVGVVVITNICESNKRKLEEKYGLKKIGVITFVIGVAYVKADHSGYKDFHKFIRENKEQINKYVEAFKNPSTPENILFDLIEKGVDDLDLLESSKGGKSL